MRKESLIKILIIGIFFSSALVFAEPEEYDEVDSDMETPTPVQRPKKQSGQGSGERLIRGKEAEGTEALGRFESDSIQQSQYKLGGKSLEVDPD